MIFNLPLQPRFIFIPVFLAIIMIGLHLLEPISTQWFGLFPERVLQGELWRVLTGQLLHTNTNHLLLNLSGLLLVWALHGEHYRPTHLMAITVLSLIMIGILLLFYAQYHHYAGFSGVLHALLIYGAILDVVKQDKTGWLLLGGIAFKVAYENIFGASSDTEAMIGAAVATEAHLIGVIVGCFLAIPYFYLQTFIKK